MTTENIEDFHRNDLKKQQNKDNFQIENSSKLTFNEKIKIKSYTNDSNKINCIIKDIKYNDETAILLVSPEFSTSIEKTVKLDATFKLDDKSEFESFLKSNGISPFDQDFENKLLDKSIEFYVYIDENKNIKFKYNKDNCQNVLNNGKEIKQSRGMNRDSPFSINGEKETITKSPGLGLFLILFFVGLFLLFIIYLPMIILTFLV